MEEVAFHCLIQPSLEHVQIQVSDTGGDINKAVIRNALGRQRIQDDRRAIDAKISQSN